MARYQNGRGFYGSSVISSQTTIGDLASMNRADLGFKDFWRDPARTDLGAGVGVDYDWRTLQRGNIKQGVGPMRGPPSPMRGIQKASAARTPGMTPVQYRRWNDQIGSRMTWGGHQRDPHTGKALKAGERGPDEPQSAYVGGFESAPRFVETGSGVRRGTSRTAIPRAGGPAAAIPMPAAGSSGPRVQTIMGAPDPFGELEPAPATPTGTYDDRNVILSKEEMADIESHPMAQGVVGRGVVRGVKKINTGRVTTPWGAAGAVAGGVARSVGGAVVNKAGEAVKSRWGGAKPPGSQMPPTMDMPF